MSAAERLLALARWRWTPFLGLAAGTATLVFGMATIVPERFGSVLAPPPRRNPLPLANTSTLPDTSVTQRDEAPPVSAPRISPPPTRVARTERRRGFSPVIRPDEPPAPPETEDEAVARIEQPQRTAEEQRRWEEGQAAAARAATRAARHAGAVAGRAFGPSRRSIAEAAPDEAEDDVADEAEEEPAEASEGPARPPEDNGQDGNAPPVDAPDEDVE